MNKVAGLKCESCNQETPVARVIIEKMTFNVCEGCVPSEYELEEMTQIGDFA